MEGGGGYRGLQFSVPGPIEALDGPDDQLDVGTVVFVVYSEYAKKLFSILKVY